MKKTSSAIKGDYTKSPIQPKHSHQTIFVDFEKREVTEVRDYENGKLTSVYSTGDQPSRGQAIFTVLVVIAVVSCYYTTTSLMELLG